MHFLTTSTIHLSCLASAAPQADSWWLGHVEPDDVLIADIAGQALDIFLHGPESAHKNGFLKTFTHTSIPIHPCTLLKNKSKQKTIAKRSTYQTWCFRLLVLFLSSVLVGDDQEAWQRIFKTAPRRRSCRLGQYWQNICRCVQHILQHFPTTIPFLATFTIPLSCLASAAPQADSWWLGHVEPDDVVIADIAGQALDIFLHGPESAHKNGIVKTFTHTSIPIHPCTLLKNKQKTIAKRSTHQTCFRLLVLFLSSVLVGDDQEAWQRLFKTAPRRMLSRLGQYWFKTFVDVIH